MSLFWKVSIAMIVFFVASIVFVWFYYPSEQWHYMGESHVSGVHYIEIITNETLDKEYNELTVNDDGSLIFKYDFFSEDEYPYLVNKGNVARNDVLIYRVLRFLKDNVIPIIFMLIITAITILAVLKYKRLLNIIKIFDHRCESVPFANIVKTSPPSLIDNVNGILSVRSWNANRHGDLKSIVQGTKWDKKELVAHKLPGNNDNGIYAYRIGSCVYQKSTVMGIVELDGKYEYHPEGLIRAEHCKILCLFISERRQKLGRLISYKYGVPLTFGESSEIAYMHWLYSDIGQRSLEYNYQLLKEGDNGSSN